MSKKVDQNRARQQKRRRASRRKAGLLILGIGVGLFEVYAAITSGAGLKDPPSRFLSEDKLAELPPPPERGFNYRVRSTPTTFFLDITGEIQAVRIGVVSYGWLESNVKRALN